MDKNGNEIDKFVASPLWMEQVGNRVIYRKLSDDHRNIEIHEWGKGKLGEYQNVDHHQYPEYPQYDRCIESNDGRLYKLFSTAKVTEQEGENQKKWEYEFYLEDDKGQKIPLPDLDNGLKYECDTIIIRDGIVFYTATKSVDITRGDRTYKEKRGYINTTFKGVTIGENHNLSEHIHMHATSDGFVIEANEGGYYSKTGKRIILIERASRETLKRQIDAIQKQTETTLDKSKS